MASTTTEQDGHELPTILARSLQWQNADVFALGRQDTISRLGEIAGYISMLVDEDGNLPAESVKVVLPPAGGRDAAKMRDDVREGVRRAYRRFETEDGKTAPFVERALEDLEVEQAANFTFASLASLLDQAQSRQVLIVGEAAHYRLPDVAAGANEPHLPEDVWCAHLHGVMLMAEETARAHDSYVILDIGEHLPSRASNIELLKSAGDVGLCGGGHEAGLSPEAVVAKVTAAYELAAAGNLGRALSLVDNDENLSDLGKWHLRLAVLERAGSRDEVSRILDDSAETITKLNGKESLGVARIAVGIERDDLAQQLIEHAMPELLAVHDLEHALQIALDTRREALVAKVRERFRELHPESQLLRSVDARRAAHEGDYARAATLLSGSANTEERVTGDLFRLLADAVGGLGFANPVGLGREVAVRMPDQTASIQREIMRSLERADRRDEAVAMLFAGDVVWNEGWFVFARGLLGRSLASGSTVVGRELLSRLVDKAAAHMARHPADGLARTSVADLLEAENMGIDGIALLVTAALERAARQPEVVESYDPDPKRLDDIERLPSIMGRVMEWLAEKGDGMIVASRDAIPTEVLGEDPDAVLAGLLRMVNFYTPDASDPADELLIRNFVAVALAVAPAAVAADADLPVLRGGAIKMILAGRPQVARDLAEQALVIAGDRPDRRRKALAAFADIYARVGRVREALLALIAAFELPPEGTWREAWTEQSILLRILRDVGLADGAIHLIERLRRALANVSNADVYHSRLDTLELHAQLRKFQTRSEDAWSTTRLLEAAMANAEAVLTAGDEPLPIAVMLRQIIDRAAVDGTEVPVAARQSLERLTSDLAAPYQTLLAAVERLPHVSTVAAVVGPIQASRYNDDVSYDLRLVRTMGSRLTRAATEAADSEGFAYAVELLAAQGIGVRGAGGEVKAAERILADRASPLAVAKEIAGLGLPVVGVAYDEKGLMAMTVTADGSEPPLAVATATFDPERLVEWSRVYPRHYSDSKLSPEEFRGATERLGLPNLPERALIVSGDLSLMPPNVLTVEDDLAGRTKALATVPSLAWLKASVMADRKGDGTASAWIPVAAGGSYMDTLSLMAGEMEGVLQPEGIPLHTQSATPVALASADLAIIGAHGGLAEDNRFFRGLSDDQREPADMRQLIDALRGSRVAVLFVCSGGRMDQHPESGGLVGIAHRLLDNGLDAVVAPSWPIPFTIARPWLAAFLESWKKGRQIIDACHSGNGAVAAATSHDVARSLAMTLYGNPFIKR